MALPREATKQPSARATSRVEDLARELYVAMLGNASNQWATSTLRHTAGKAISAANDFYEVLENGMED